MTTMYLATDRSLFSAKTSYRWLSQGILNNVAIDFLLWTTRDADIDSIANLVGYIHTRKCYESITLNWS